MGIRIDMGSDKTQQAAIALCNQMDRKDKIFEMMETKRSRSQNDMVNALYRQLAGQMQDQSFNDIRYECKLTIGVPILRRDNDAFRAFYNAGLLALTYEQKLVAMAYIDITSLMNKTQGTEFIEEVIKTYSKQGYSLTNEEQQ
jgi:hypothetical protein|tara:strand:+ start:230 stop:658 length:429 start_codon:yes stop_codon:yes gene_type:complete